MKHKLRDLLEYFEDVEIIYILTEENHICVNIKKRGSYFLLKHFLDEEFKLEYYSESLKTLKLSI